MKQTIKHEIADGKCIITSSFTQKNQFMQLIEVLKKVKEEQLTVILKIKPSLEQFYMMMGEKCVGNTELSKVNMPDVTGEGDDYFHIMVGKHLMDYYITKTYYVKSESEKMVYVIKEIDNAN
jgi:hypothetical protein